MGCRIGEGDGLPGLSVIELDESLSAVYDGMRADVTPDDFRCLHVWRQVITPDGKFTNIGVAVIWASPASRGIQAPETPQARQDKLFHDGELAEGLNASWLP